MKIAIYPGSFDPIHDGHINIISKAAKLFDKLYVVVSLNIKKNNQMSFDKRVELVKEKLINVENIEVLVNEYLLTTEFAKQLNAKYLVRGLRSNDDLKYEFEYYDGIKTLDNELEIVYFFSDSEKRAISSSILKEIEHFERKK